MPSPSHSSLAHAFSQRFVGRRTELDLFETMLWERTAPSQYQVLSFFGMGGQGKTTLLDRFAMRLESHDCRDRPVARLDFGIAGHRVPAEGLFTLRNQLRAYGVPTHAFDMAFARHFGLTRPGRDLAREYPELYRFKEDSLLGEIVDLGADVANEIPGGKLAVSMLARLSNKVAQWYRSRGVEVLARLDSMSAQEVSLALPMFLGHDIAGFLLDHPQRRPVLLLDTYEALWREQAASVTGNVSGDGWLRRFAEEAPGCFMVVVGRRRVGWETHDRGWAPFLVCRPLGELSEAEADELLNAGGVAAPDARSLMRTVASGHPLSLAVSIRYYQMRVRAGAAPAADELPRTHQEILDRFFDHLDPPVRGLMRALAVPTAIRRELWSHLARTGFSAFDLYAQGDIFGEVFFLQRSADTFTMHERVRDHLLNDLLQKDPDLLQRVRLAVFDFHDRASATDPAERAGTAVPDLSGSLTARDESMAEAASHLMLASPERYIHWCAARLGEDQRGSRRRAELVEQAQGALGPVGERNLLDAATLARLKISVDPWASDGVELVARIAELAPHTPWTLELTEQLRPVAQHLLRANPDALPPAMVKALREGGVDDIDLALAAGDLESAIRFVEAAVQSRTAPIAVWNEIVAVARASRDDLAGRLCVPFQGQPRDNEWLGELARIVDSFNLLDLPAFGLAAATSAFETSDSLSMCDFLLDLTPCVVTHQLSLSLFESFAQCGQVDAARRLIDGRFGNVARQALWDGLHELTPAGVEALSLTEGKALVDTIEKRFGLWGFLHGYIEAALLIDAHFLGAASLAVRAMLTMEITRVRRIYGDLGGRPTYSTLRKNHFELVLNDRAQIYWFFNDALLLWRPIDWIAFAAGGMSFSDARQGKARRIGLAPEEADKRTALWQCVGDGASIMVVLVDQHSQPSQGWCVAHYGKAWLV